MTVETKDLHDKDVQEAIIAHSINQRHERNESYKLTALLTVAVGVFLFFLINDRLILGIAISGALAMPILSLAEKKSQLKAQRIHLATMIPEDTQET